MKKKEIICWHPLYFTIKHWFLFLSGSTAALGAPMPAAGCRFLLLRCQASFTVSPRLLLDFLFYFREAGRMFHFFYFISFQLLVVVVVVVADECLQFDLPAAELC